MREKKSELVERIRKKRSVPGYRKNKSELERMIEREGGLERIREKRG
jgi:hypothetical protein